MHVLLEPVRRSPEESNMNSESLTLELMILSLVLRGTTMLSI
jgi:hypothetical protein